MHAYKYMDQLWWVIGYQNENYASLSKQIRKHNTYKYYVVWTVLTVKVCGHSYTDLKYDGVKVW